MRTISAGLKAHLAQTETTICTLIKIELKDASLLLYTDHDQSITYDGGTYVPLNSVVPTSLISSNDMSASSQDITGFLVDGIITISRVMADYLLDAVVTTRLVNYADLTQGSVTLQRASLGLVELRENTFKVELRDRAFLLRQTVGELYQYSCRVDLGSTRCGVNLASYTVTGTVTTVNSVNEFTDSSRSETDDWFTYGLLTWVTGNNAGLKMEVIRYKSKKFSLLELIPGVMQVGDQYSVYAGCDKRVPTCRDKFSNLVNYRGFPFVPGETVYGLTQGRKDWIPTYDI